MALKHSRILITGATGVIGNEIARALAEPGVTLALHYHRSRERAEALAGELARTGAKVHLLPRDLSIAAQAAALAQQARELLGGMDLLVHAAANFERTPLGMVTEAQWEAVFDMNLKAAFFLAQTAAEGMRESGGSIIFLSDVAARRPYGGYLPHCLAKAGIDALTRGLARSLAPAVTVNAVAPYVVTRPKGISDWEWNDILEKTPLKRPSAPQEVAAVVKMLASFGESITGQIISIDGGRLIR